MDRVVEADAARVAAKEDAVRVAAKARDAAEEGAVRVAAKARVKVAGMPVSAATAFAPTAAHPHHINKAYRVPRSFAPIAAPR